MSHCTSTLEMSSSINERASESEPPPIGLSTSAYLAAPPVLAAVRISCGGFLVETKPLLNRPRGIGGGARGVIKGFSASSRRRLRRRLAAFRSDALRSALFVTLTYPDAFPDDRTCKKQFQAWCKRLLRRYPAAGLIWKMELQQRGAPHFHVLIMGVRFIPYTWVAKSWFEVVASGDLRHLAAGTQVRRVHSVTQARSYVEKYMGKVDAASEETGQGRLWGLKGNWEQYLAPVLSLIMDTRSLAKLARVCDGIQRGQVKARRKVSNRALKWAKRRKRNVTHRTSTWFVPCDGWPIHVSDICGTAGILRGIELPNSGDSREA